MTACQIIAATALVGAGVLIIAAALTAPPRRRAPRVDEGAASACCFAIAGGLLAIFWTMMLPVGFLLAIVVAAFTLAILHALTQWSAP